MYTQVFRARQLAIITKILKNICISYRLQDQIDRTPHHINL